MIATPRRATTVCVVRDGSTGLEVLMVRRSATARFMGGTWVFPGGVVDEIDGSPRAAALVPGVDEDSLPWVVAGLRELVEEVGLWITDEPFVRRPDDGATGVFDLAERAGYRFDGSGMTLFAHWITPEEAAVRFDTKFYAVAIPGALVPEPDGTEVDDAGWVDPGEAHAAATSGGMAVPFPTRRTLEYLSLFESVGALIAHAGSLGDVAPIQPRIRVGGDGLLDIVLPGEDGFDELEGSGVDPEALRRAAERSREAGTPVPEVGR